MSTRDLRAAMRIVADTPPSAEHGLTSSNLDGLQDVQSPGRADSQDGLPPLLDGLNIAGQPVMSVRLDAHQDPWVLSMSPWLSGAGAQVIDL
jgi:hypothetical protein